MLIAPAPATTKISIFAARKPYPKHLEENAALWLNDFAACRRQKRSGLRWLQNCDLFHEQRPATLYGLKWTRQLIAHESRATLNANHINRCEFQNQGDPLYQPVLDALTDINATLPLTEGTVLNLLILSFRPGP